MKAETIQNSIYWQKQVIAQSRDLKQRRPRGPGTCASPKLAAKLADITNRFKGQTMKQFFIDLSHAALFAACIGAPFAGFFYFYGA